MPIFGDKSKVASSQIEILFKNHFRSLSYFAYSFVKDKQEAEDIVQESFINLIEKSSILLDNSSNPLSYLYSTIRNKCINVLRHRKVEVSSATEIRESNSLWDEDHQRKVIKSEVFGQLYSAIDKLPEECRKIYTLTYFFKMSEAEVAQLLSISINTVKSQKQRGKVLLRKLLEGFYSIFF